MSERSSGNAAGGIKAVAFDFDGVLVESVDVKTRAFGDIYAPHGPRIVEEVVAYHLKNGGLSRQVKFRHYQEKLLGRPLDEAQLCALANRFAVLVEDAVVASPWVPGALEALKSLHGRLPLYVASGTPQDELRRIVERRGAAQYFHGVYGSPDTKATILSRLAVQYGAAHLLMVGDSITDLEGAIQAGTRFLGRIAPDPCSGSAAENPFPAGISVVRNLLDLPQHL